MSALQRNIWLFVAVVFAVCLTVFALSYIVTNPCHILPGLGGDSAKNEFVYLYQSIWGKGIWFTGMNYPYGEHIVFLDGQPLLSVTLSYFKHVTAEQALGILWSLVGVSYVLSIVFIYRILSHFKVGAPVAIVFAGLIAIFTPQVFRIEGHYGLSYVCILPMLFYWNIRYYEQQQGKYCFYIFLLGIITVFLHPYYAALILIWIAFYAVGYFIFIKGRALDKLKHISFLLAAIFAVLIIVAVVMKITDPVTDRPATPYGMLTYIVRPSNILTSTHSPAWDEIERHHRLSAMLPNVSGSDSEGYGYIGLVAIFTVICSLIIGIVKKIRKDKANIIVQERGFSPVWLFIACAALLFSMGVPYIWHMEWLPEYISFLRQFRSLGRFNWIFYNIITIYSVVVLYRYYTKLVMKRRFVGGYTILLLAIGFWAYEASGYVKYTREIAYAGNYNYKIFLGKEDGNWKDYLQKEHFPGDDFQAILMLSYYQIGSDKLWVGDAGWRNTLATEAALQLHMPMLNGYMTRSSWSNAFGQVKIVAGPYADKPVLQAIKSNKPFLLLQFDNDSLDADQRYLLQASDYIGHFRQCFVYACYPDRLRANIKRDNDSVLKILPYMHNAQDTCVANKEEWYVNHLDNGGASEHLFGSGAQRRIGVKDSVVLLIPVRPSRDSENYELSAWFLLAANNYTSPSVNIVSLDSTGSPIDTVQMDVNKSVDNYGMWFRGGLYFPLRAKCRSLRLRLINDPVPSYIVMDEVLLRPADALIISKAADGSVMVNNHLFKQKQ